MNASGSNHSPADDAIEGAAVAWLCERDEGFTPARARAFAVWHEADPRHAAAVVRVERSLDLLGQMPAVRAPLEARFGAPTAGEDALPLTARRRFPAPLWAAGLAAALALGSVLWWRAPVGSNGAQYYVTEAGAQRRVELPDGSIVNVNASSKVRVHFTPTQRQVTLAAGEAHFAVAHDTSRPFIVTAEGVSVRAVGTAFNVRVASAAVEVLVVEGRVEVARVATAAVTSPAPHPLIAAGERASVARHDPALTPTVEKAEARLIRETLAWHSRVMSFSDVPLRDVVIQFNWRNAKQLVIADSDFGARKVGGTFALDQVDAFVRLLEQDGDVVVEPRGENEIVLRRVR